MFEVARIWIGGLAIIVGHIKEILGGVFAKVWFVSHVVILTENKTFLPVMNFTVDEYCKFFTFIICLYKIVIYKEQL